MVVCRTSVFIKWNNSLIGLQMKDGSILIVDENIEILASLESFLANHIENITTCSDPEKVRMLVTKQIFDVVLLDINFSKIKADGSSLHQFILKNAKGISVILLTAYSDLELAVAAVNEGAIDFLQKPWDNHKLLNSINTCIRLRRQALELETLKQQQQGLISSYRPIDHLIVGKSDAMKQVIDIIQKVASTNASVFLLGENGTGKSLAAAEIHRLSERRNEPFVSVDLGSLNENIFESELFGHVKGAFTDAKEERIGRVEAAHGGTLFLDEIGNLSLPLQAKLLTAIQTGQITKVGATKPITVDVRLISATNQPIEVLVASGRFREDLFYRINTIQLTLPPLRERLEDLPELISTFLPKVMTKYGKPKLKLSSRALKEMEAYSWPGNVRELQHTLEKAVILSDGKEISAQDLALKSPHTPAPKDAVLTLDNVEKIAISDVLKRTKGNLSKAARMLGITRPTLYKKMEKYGL